MNGTASPTVARYQSIKAQMQALLPKAKACIAALAARARRSNCKTSASPRLSVETA